MSLNISGSEDSIKATYTSLTDYINALVAVVTNKLPNMIKEAEGLTE